MAHITIQPQVKYHHLRPNGYHGVDEEAVGHLAPRCDHICVGLGTRLELSNNFTSSMQHRWNQLTRTNGNDRHPMCNYNLNFRFTSVWNRFLEKIMVVEHLFRKKTSWQKGHGTYFNAHEILNWTRALGAKNRNIVCSFLNWKHMYHKSIRLLKYLSKNGKWYEEGTDRRNV